MSASELGFDALFEYFGSGIVQHWPLGVVQLRDSFSERSVAVGVVSGASEKDHGAVFVGEFVLPLYGGRI